MTRPPPPPPVTRWTPQRKAALLLAVITHQLTMQEACRRYDLGEAELAAWFAAFRAYGPAGLRVTRLQQVRNRLREPRRKPRKSPRC